MCGRFTLALPLETLASRFGFRREDILCRPRYNIAPTQDVLTVVGSPSGNTAQYMKWGLIPGWAKDVSIGNRMINARAETVAQRPAFRAALKKRRCLVLADGFYEWKATREGKAPLRIALVSGEPFAFAGLWEAWSSPTGESIRSCTIITTTPNETMAAIHHRMPVILTPEAEPTWLSPDVLDTRVLTGLLIPYAGQMTAYRVSTMVNSPANDGPELLARV